MKASHTSSGLICDMELDDGAFLPPWKEFEQDCRELLLKYKIDHITFMTYKTEKGCKLCQK